MLLASRYIKNMNKVGLCGCGVDGGGSWLVVGVLVQNASHAGITRQGRVEKTQPIFASIIKMC